MISCIYVEGDILFAEGDPSGDQHDLNGADYAWFVDNGYMTRECTPHPSFTDIVGSPLIVTKREDRLHLRAIVGDPHFITLFENKASLGFALAGVIKEREGSLVKKLEIKSVAIVPANQLVDPRCVCVCTLVEDEE